MESRQALTVPTIIADGIPGSPRPAALMVSQSDVVQLTSANLYARAGSRGIFILLSVLLFVPGVRRLTPFERTLQCRSLFGISEPPRLDDVDFADSTRSLCWCFCRDNIPRGHFRGDGQILRCKSLKQCHCIDWPRAPLTFALIRTLDHAGSTNWLTAENDLSRPGSYASVVLLRTDRVSCCGRPRKPRAGDNLSSWPY